MREPLVFTKVETPAGWDELREFAASFDHRIDDTSMTPLVAVSRGRRLFAYFFVCRFPVIMPSFHPGHTTHRDFVDTVDQIRAWAQLNSLGNERFPNGVVWAAFDKDPVIPREKIEKLGLRATGCELWQGFPQ